MKYICHDIFMVRTPMLPIEIGKKLCMDENVNAWKFIVEYGLQSYMQEALTISSPELVAAIGRLGKDKKRDGNTLRSLYKYLLRASMRTTPFGLLANASMGEFSEDASEIIKNTSVIKRLYADGLWVNKLIAQLEEKEENRRELSLMWNPNCYRYGERLYNPHYSKQGQGKQTERQSTSIRYTSLVELIMRAAKNPVKYSNLECVIKKEYKEKSREQVCKVLDDLIKQEYLFTELRRPAYCKNPIGHIVNCLEKLNLEPDLRNELTQIERDMILYEEDTNKDIRLKNIIGRMAAIIVSESYLEVDAGNDLKKGYLNSDVKKKLEKFVECIKYIGTESRGHSSIKKLKDAFKEEYGNNIEVPLIQVIDYAGFDGLQYYNEFSIYDTEREKRIKKIVCYKILDSLKNNRKAVNLCKKDFENVGWNDQWTLPNSFDLTFFLTGSPDDLKITLGPNIGAVTAGKSFQRFEEVLTPELFLKYNSIYQKTNSPRILDVELRENPTWGKMSNILNWSSNYEYSMLLGMPPNSSDEQCLRIEDLVVGLDINDRLYLKSLSKNAYCNMVADNMLNYQLNSPLFNLLRSISSDYVDVKIVEGLAGLQESDYPYLPQINVEGVTVQQERWILTCNYIETKDFESFKDSFFLYDEKFMLPTVFYLCHYDNRLIIHKYNDSSLAILYREIKRKEVVQISAIEENFFESEITKDEKGYHYVTECVFSFYQNSYEPPMFHVNDVKAITIQEKNRIVHPFEDGWVSLKVYCNLPFENDFLISFLHQKDALDIDLFFFVRYADENGAPHIRLRVKYSNEKKALNRFSKLKGFLLQASTNTYIKKWEICEYHRENNRYGGYQLLKKIENYFFYNSEQTIELLAKNDFKNEEIIKDIYVEIIAKMLYQFVEEKEKIFALLASMVSEKAYRDEYRSNRKKYMDKVEKIFASNESDLEVKKVIQSLHKQGNLLTNDMDSIIQSIVHMCCNRLSRQRFYEDFSYSIIRHAVRDLIKKEEYLKM